MQDRDKVWVAEPRAGFVLGRIVEFAEEGPVVQPEDRSIKPITTGRGPHQFPHRQSWNFCKC